MVTEGNRSEKRGKKSGMLSWVYISFGDMPPDCGARAYTMTYLLIQISILGDLN